MPVNIDWPDTIPKKGEGIFLRFTDINVVPKEAFPYVANTIKQINIVMKSLIPEINIEIYNAFDKLLKDVYKRQQKQAKKLICHHKGELVWMVQQFPTM